ncbi:hypothetical protein E4U32_004840 [Claviceps aff. humidiphila group G2b]|nr:hypothetical protein E4U32_004840 [Claviceps aff. humidiphila group G2b]
MHNPRHLPQRRVKYMRGVISLQLYQRLAKVAALVLTTSSPQPPPSHVNPLRPLPGLANITQRQSLTSQKPRSISSHPQSNLAMFYKRHALR